MSPSSWTRPRPRGKGTRPRVPRTTRSPAPTAARPSRHTRPLSSTLPDSSHCLRLRLEASGKSMRSFALRVAASLTSEHSQRALAEELLVAETANTESEHGRSNESPRERAQRAAPAHVERPVEHAPGEAGGQRRAAETGRRAEERVLDGEDAGHEPTRRSQSLEDHALVEPLMAAHSEGAGGDDQPRGDADPREQADGQRDL